MNYGLLDEKLLISRFKEGDIESFNEIYRRNYQSIYSYLLRLSDYDLANEVTQNTFFTFFKKMKNQPNIEIPIVKNFLIGIARIELLACRKRKRKDISLNENDSISEISSNENIHDKFEGKEISDIVRKSVDSLPEEYREVLVLSVYEELTDVEISTILEIPVGTVKTRKREAKHILKELLKPMLNS